MSEIKGHEAVFGAVDEFQTIDVSPRTAMTSSVSAHQKRGVRHGGYTPKYDSTKARSRSVCDCGLRIPSAVLPTKRTCACGEQYFSACNRTIRTTGWPETAVDDLAVTVAQKMRTAGLGPVFEELEPLDFSE